MCPMVGLMALRRLIIAFRARVMPRRWLEAQYLHPLDLHAPVALVHDGNVRPFIGKDFDLLDRFVQRIPVIRLARHADH